MARWQPDARGRLEQAALELYAERGFDATTVAEIAERAGLTERTFFRHFADKREVLFWGQDALVQQMTTAITDAPASATPMEAVAAALKAVGPFFDGRRAHARNRQAVVDANSGLRERELIKLALLSAALAQALQDRGVPEPVARLTAETGIAVFKVAFVHWLTDPVETPYADIVDAELHRLRTVTAQS